MREMKKHIIFFLVEDDLSYSIAAILDGLIEELGDKVKLHSQRYLGAILTELKITLRSNFTKKHDTLKVIVYSLSDLYKERYKSMFNIPLFPAVSLGEYEYFGEEAVDIASELYSILTSRDRLSSEQVVHCLLRRAREMGRFNVVEVKCSEDSKACEKNSIIVNLYKHVFRELMKKLDKLRLERKIDDMRYRKIKGIYAQLLEIKLLEIG